MAVAALQEKGLRMTVSSKCWLGLHIPQIVIQLSIWDVLDKQVRSIKAPPQGSAANGLVPNTAAPLQRSCCVRASDISVWKNGYLHNIRPVVLMLWLIGVYRMVNLSHTCTVYAANSLSVRLFRYHIQAARPQGTWLLRGSQVHTSFGEPLYYSRIQRHPQLLRQRHTKGQFAHAHSVWSENKICDCWLKASWWQFLHTRPILRCQFNYRSSKTALIVQFGKLPVNLCPTLSAQSDLVQKQDGHLKWGQVPDDQ